MMCIYFEQYLLEQCSVTMKELGETLDLLLFHHYHCSCDRYHYCCHYHYHHCHCHHSNYHLLSTYGMLVIYMHNLFTFNNIMRETLLQPLCYFWGNWGLNMVKKVIKAHNKSGRARIQNHVWLHSFTLLKISIEHLLHARQFQKSGSKFSKYKRVCSIKSPPTSFLLPLLHMHQHPF